MRLLSALVLCCLAIAPFSASASDGIEDYYGYWGPIEEEFWCTLSKEDWEIEGGQVVILPKKFLIGGSFCEDVGMWMHEGRLRISAACRGEAGAGAVNREFWIDRGGVMFFKDGDGEGPRQYRKCPTPD